METIFANTSAEYLGYKIFTIFFPLLIVSVLIWHEECCGGHTKCTQPEIGAYANPDKSDISDIKGLIDESMCVFNSDDDQTNDINISFESTGELGSPGILEGRFIYYSIAIVKYYTRQH